MSSCKQTWEKRKESDCKHIDVSKPFLSSFGTSCKVAFIFFFSVDFLWLVDVVLGFPLILILRLLVKQG